MANFGDFWGTMKTYIDSGGIYFNNQQDAAFYQQQLAQQTPYGIYSRQQQSLGGFLANMGPLAQAVGRQFPAKPVIVRRDVARDIGYDVEGNAYTGDGRLAPPDWASTNVAWLDGRVNEMRVRL